MTKTDSTQMDDTLKEECLQDTATETAVVSAMLNGLAYEPCTDDLTKDCFADVDARAIFSNMYYMKKEGKPIDWLNVQARIESVSKDVVTKATLMEIAGLNPIYDLDEKVKRLHMLAVRRRLYFLSQRIERVALDLTSDIASSVNQFTQKLERISQTSLNQVVTFEQSYAQLEEMVEQACQDNEVMYSHSGFSVIDENALLRPTALTVIGAYSGNGKSALALTIAYNVASTGNGVAYYSLEMSHTELTGRMAAHIADVEPKSLLYGINRPEDMLQRVREAKDKVRGLPIYYDDMATMTFHAMEASIRQLARSRKIKGVVIDYVQILMRNVPARKDKTEEGILGDILRDLKNIAKQEGIWIIALSQLNRNHADEEPRESDLRGSGQINESADGTLLLWRPGKYGKSYTGENMRVDTNGTAQLYAAKVRNGEEGKKEIIRFRADRAHFEEFEEGAVPLVYVETQNGQQKYGSKTRAGKVPIGITPEKTEEPTQKPNANQPTEGSIPF